ncbi:hypothetical protein EJ07DRAFT_167155 [Lizonia empirigonia]|nr:hypothetical protein EJ07DRAFT_167155 [Lizonia empirigonia]
MKLSALALTAVAEVVTAHYFFDTNIVDGVAQPAFKYVRQSSRAVRYNPIKFSSNPAADIRDGSTVDGLDIVMTVNAGEEVRLKLAAPTGSVKAYDGSGDWFKIFEEGVCDGGDFTSTAWCDYDRDRIAATIPKDTPNGEYLLRAENIGVHLSHVNQPEHYVACMQIKVQGGGSGTPGPMVKFPGAYRATDPYANFSIYGGRKDFPMPGPAVWTGGAANGSTTTPTKEEVPAATPTQAAGQTGCAKLWG